jgi:hypothetical protein
MGDGEIGFGMNVSGISVVKKIGKRILRFQGATADLLAGWAL